MTAATVEQRISALLLARRAEMRHPDPPLAIALGIQTAFALMQQHVLIEGTWVDGRALSDDELQRELVTMFLGYVGIEPRASRSSTQGRRAPNRRR